MISIRTEKLIPLRELPNHVPRRNGRKLSLASAYRWSLVGVRGTKLETVQLGGTRFTSAEAIQRFVDALTAARDGQPAAERYPAGVAARRRQEEVARQLDAVGI